MPIATTITASLFNLFDSSGEIYASLQILYERGSPEWILEPLITIGSFQTKSENSLFIFNTTLKILNLKKFLII